MAEVQTNTESGETTRKFIEFVMMQAQNTMLFLGQIPHPGSGQPEVNLDVAKMFIDQLVMIREKTRNNLNNDESGVLNNAISNLQMAFVEVLQAGGGAAPSAEAPAAVEPPAAAAPESAPAENPAPAPDESKKKFTKSYGS